MTTSFPQNLQTALRQIVAQASILFERLDRQGPFLSIAKPEDEPLIQSRLDEWTRAISAEGKREELHRFLEWEGLDMADAEQAVGPVRLREDAPLPPWAETLGDVLASEPTDFENLPGLLDPDAPLPFEDLLAPFVYVFRQRLAAQAASGYDLLSAEARTALERALLARLAASAAQTFHIEFQVSRMTGMSPLARLLPQESDTLYRGFVRRLQANGLMTFFLKYPVLARKLATRTHLWTEAHVEFLQRLAADLPEIARVFGPVPPPPSNSPQRGENQTSPPLGGIEGGGWDDLGQIKGLKPALSDPHRGGRGAISLTFELAPSAVEGSGLRLIYKPKNLGAGAAYNQLLAWLNERGAPLDMKALGMLNRTTHGWVEFADHAPCADKAAVARYYRRVGGLLCLVYALEGTDCHAENLIASGEHPVLIDNETLLHHRVQLEGEKLETLRASAQFEAYEQLDHSVLRTGLLPGWQVGRDQRIAYDISGLGGYADQALPYRMPKWVHVNSDRMALTFEQGKVPPRANVPRLDDTSVPLDGHLEAVMEGFEEMYRFLLTQREPLLASGGPLEAFEGQTVRFVFRATQIYALILKQISQPRYLCDGADYSIPLEMLARAHLLTEEKPPNWPVLRAERSAMQQLDIPFFTSRTDSDALELEGGQGEIEGYFTEPSFDLTVERLKDLDEADLARQMELIKVVLYTRVADERREDREVGRQGDKETGEGREAEALEPKALVAEAVGLAEGLDARAIRGTDGSVTWIAPQYMPQAERFQLGYLSFNLYDGLAGVALFLAALENVGGWDGARDLCLAALQPLREALQEEATVERAFQWLEIGGTAGLGSVLYVLARVAQFLDEPVLLEEARAAAQLLTPEQIAADEALDIADGSAGAILGLLAVHEASQDAIALERAVECGQHLLESRVSNDGGPRAWAVMGERPLTGFAHGAAGIAYALLRLHAVTGETDFRAAAKEAIAYETSVFVASEGNWPDFRPDHPAPDPDHPKFMAAWCHGATGIGLARLGGLPALDTPAIRRDIEFALATTQRTLADQHLHADHVCCGNMGRVEFLLAAGTRLARPGLAAAARREAFQIVARAEQAGGYRLSNALPRGVHSPGFFQGAAGVGYELLRLAYPGQIPSVLLWE
jgi:type 2 lantibiotic biosynthesis protein LanM